MPPNLGAALGQGRDVKLPRSYRSCDRKCQNGGRVNSFQNLLFQTHQLECYKILVTTLGQGGDVKLRKSRRSCDRKCAEMAIWVNFGENRQNFFKNIILQTHQSECFQIWVTTLDQVHIGPIFFIWFLTNHFAEHYNQALGPSPRGTGIDQGLNKKATTLSCLEAHILHRRGNGSWTLVSLEIKVNCSSTIFTAPSSVTHFLS